jgi:hypothetical protein
MWSCELVLYWGRRRVISDEGISDHNSTATCTHEVKYEPCCEEMKWQHERGPCRNAEDSNPTEGTNAPEGVIALAWSADGGRGSVNSVEEAGRDNPSTDCTRPRCYIRGLSPISHQYIQQAPHHQERNSHRDHAAPCTIALPLPDSFSPPLFAPSFSQHQPSSECRPRMCSTF